MRMRPAKRLRPVIGRVSSIRPAAVVVCPWLALRVVIDACGRVQGVPVPARSFFELRVEAVSRAQPVAAAVARGAALRSSVWAAGLDTGRFLAMAGMWSKTWGSHKKKPRAVRARGLGSFDLGFACQLRKSHPRLSHGNKEYYEANERQRGQPYATGAGVGGLKGLREGVALRHERQKTMCEVDVSTVSEKTIAKT